MLPAGGRQDIGLIEGAAAVLSAVGHLVIGGRHWNDGSDLGNHPEM